MLFKYPINLLFFTPDNIPIIVPCLLPLSILKRIVDTIFKGCFEFYVVAD